MSRRAGISDYKELIQENIQSESFLKATFSGEPANKDIPWIKIIIRPVLLKGERYIQISYLDARKDITKNYRGSEAVEKVAEIIALEFRNVHMQTTQKSIDIVLTRKGQPLIHQKKLQEPTRKPDLSHDHQKQLVLTAEDAAPFLQEVGIMTQEGKIKADKQHKFRQINEFLKQIEQAGALDRAGQSALSVVDCGCGNAYLTFAFYHYLHTVLHIPARITGIDVNSELLGEMEQRAARLGWSDLSFQATSIRNFQPSCPPDVVLALHACDTATDEAIARGIQWQSKLIVSVPCCQHHLQVQLDHLPIPHQFRPVERHSILKERLGDILTDAFRALILRIMGYQTEVVQFISSEDTAKNIMIRAVKTLPVGDPQFIQEYQDLKGFWQVSPYLEQLLGDDFTSLL